MRANLLLLIIPIASALAPKEDFCHDVQEVKLTPGLSLHECTLGPSQGDPKVLQAICGGTLGSALFSPGTGNKEGKATFTNAIVDDQTTITFVWDEVDAASNGPFFTVDVQYDSTCRWFLPAGKTTNTVWYQTRWG